MHADVRKAGDVIIVDLRGDLVLGDEMLHDVLSELLTEGWKKILLNLSKVSRLDSSGMGELVRGWRAAGKIGASVKLVRVGDRVKHTLHLAQMLPLLEVFEDEKSGIASFETPS
jgi:anti-sigma B factor antagonist